MIKKFFNILFVNDDEFSLRFKRFFWGVMLIYIYIAASVHMARSPLNIFKQIPLKDSRREVKIYLPDLNGTSLLKENRKIDLSKEKEDVVRDLVKYIIQGSNYENTKITTPVNPILREVWIHENICVIDFKMNILDIEAYIVPGSEDIFIEALKKTILLNIPDIKEVYIVENGIAKRKLWSSKKID